jgi:site-specific recombinase XerD
MNDQTLEYPVVVVHHPPWNKNRIIGQKAPFKLKEICAIRAWLDIEHKVRDRALLDVAIDSKLRGIDGTSLHMEDVCHGDQVATRASVRQRKTKRPVSFEITPTTRRSLSAWIQKAGLKAGDYLFPSRVVQAGHLSTRQYGRIVKGWAGIIGEDLSRYGTHSLRRTKVTIMYRQNHNLRAAQILLGHTKIENTVKYLGVELEEALSLSEQTEV